MIVDKLLTDIGLEEKAREWANPVRLSSSGACARKIAYQLHGFEAKPLSSRARMVFRLGDTIEAELKQLLMKYPPEGLEVIIPAIQEEVVIEIGGSKIVGHIDGRVKSANETWLLEIKSISDFGFKKVLKGDIGYSYECQATAYMHALDIQRALFIFYNKNTSHVAEVIYNYDLKIWDEIVARFSIVLASTKDTLPEREYFPSEKTGKLPFQCSYCAFCSTCYPKATLTFDDKNKPQLIVAQTKGKEI